MLNSYKVIWKDLKLPTGQVYSIGICGFCNKVRAMTFENDPIRRMLIQTTDFNEDGMCLNGNHCLALDCIHNQTEPEHLLHMLDMVEDEEVDEETAKIYGTNSMLGCFIAIAKKASEEYQKERYAEPE